VFNPPYVPTETDVETWAGPVGYAWTGGESGMDVAWRVLNLLEVIMFCEVVLMVGDSVCWGENVFGVD